MHSSQNLLRKPAFTLAEVLITLAIIGIVAALTILTLVQAYNKRIVETRLKHFYVIINQAVRLSEAEYGPFEGWNSMIDSSDAHSLEKWWNTYFAPHIKTLRIERVSSNRIRVYLYDGSKCYFTVGFGQSTTSKSIHLYFYPKANSKTEIMGKDYFTFYIHSGVNMKYLPVEPYKFNWDGTESSLKSGGYGCYTTPSGTRHYCTALIQYNNWKIPDDYPYKF